MREGERVRGGIERERKTERVRAGATQRQKEIYRT